MMLASKPLTNHVGFQIRASLGKGEVVSSILTGSTINFQGLSRVSAQGESSGPLEPVMNKHGTTREEPPSSSNKTSDPLFEMQEQLVRLFNDVRRRKEERDRAAGKGMGETAGLELAREFAVEDHLGLMARVLSRCDWVGECLEWKGAKCKKGYGRIKVGGRLASTHRTVAYAAGLVQTIFGPEREQCALHACDNPSCCNPAHLFSGTLSDNMQDCAAKGRLGFQK